MADELNLLPCPFCGNDAVHVHDSYCAGSGFMVLCANCTAEGPLCNTESEAVSAWNRRAAPIAAQLDAEGLPPPVWGVVETVGDMVRNLRTLDQSLPIHTAFHVDIEGEWRCRTRSVMISRERVIDGKWVDSMRKDVPYAVIVWAKQDERAQQPAQSVDTPEFREVLSSALIPTGASMSTDGLESVVAYIDGRTAGTAGEAWIEAAKRLPRERGRYLVYQASFPEPIRVVNFGTSRGWENGRDKISPPGKRITHWMPLPAAPSPQSPAGGEGQA